MKQILLTLLLFFPMSLMAQDSYRPYLEEGKVWEFVYDDHNGYTISMVVDGDTVVNDKQCKRIFIRKGDLYTYFASMYEENKKVYYFLPDQENSIMIYDFDLKTGGSTPFLDNYTSLCGSVFDDYLTVWKMQYVLCYGNIYKRYYLFCGEMEINTIVEGIGVFEPRLDGLIDERGRMLDIYLKACYDGEGNKIFDDDGFYQPAISGINNSLIDNTKASTGNAIYDLQGRRITTPQKGGLYIRNGKKFVVH